MRSKSILVLVLVLVVSACLRAEAEALYYITDLGTLAGSRTYAIAINDFGQITGSSRIPGAGNHAYFWDSTNGMIDIGTFGGTESLAYGINNLGQVVGGASAEDDWYAFFWDRDSGIVNLGIKGSTFGINDASQMVISPSYVGDKSGGFADIGSDTIFGINNSCQVVGTNNNHAYVWDITVGMTDLGTLGGTKSRAFAINDNGQIVGDSVTPNSEQHAFIWNEDDGMVDLGTLGGDESYANSINNTGQVVGGAVTANGEWNAFIWDSINGTVNLNDVLPVDSGWSVLKGAKGINNNGQIVGYGYTDNGDYRAFLLTPIPEPSFAVNIDIKPTFCPNPLNVYSRGVLPIAILGTDDFDVTAIVATSVRLAGVEPLRNSLEDVAGLVSDSNDCNCTEDGPDGFLDLTLKFKTQKIVEAIGEVNDGDVLPLTLTGVLLGERPIEGADCILIRGRHKPINPADINKDGVVNAADFAIFAQNWLQSSIVDE
jgi:probable HAF family extracellular repeat protein